MVMYIKSLEDMEEAKKIDFNEIIKSMQVYIDSAKNTEDGKLAITNEHGTFQIYTEEEKQGHLRLHVTLNDGLNVNITSDGKETDEMEITVKSPEERKKSFSNLDFYFGLNNFLEDGSIPEGTPYDLRPSGSRYFELSFRREMRIGGKKSPFYLNYALSFSWYNFMFEGDQFASSQNGQILFNTSDVSLKKSKLTASYINMPLMLKFRSKKFSFAAGGYVGYRLGAHSKIKLLDERGDWDKIKDHGSFGLENFRYGLRAEMNWVGPTLFASYDMSEVFTPVSGGPRVNMFTFGIKL